MILLPRSAPRNAHSRTRPGLAVVLSLLLTGLAPAASSAQFLPGAGRGPGPRAEGGGIETAVLGRVGFDMQFQNLMVGGLARASFPVALTPTLQVSGDLTFFDGLTDRGAGADLLLEVIPGLFLGGGPYWRNTVYAVDPLEGPATGESRRETRLGWSAVVQLGGIGGRDRRVTGLEFRWAEIDGYNPQMLSLQFGVRLTGGGRRGR